MAPHIQGQAAEDEGGRRHERGHAGAAKRADYSSVCEVSALSPFSAVSAVSAASAASAASAVSAAFFFFFGSESPRAFSAAPRMSPSEAPESADPYCAIASFSSSTSSALI